MRASRSKASSSSFPPSPRKRVKPKDDLVARCLGGHGDAREPAAVGELSGRSAGQRRRQALAPAHAPDLDWLDPSISQNLHFDGRNGPPGERAQGGHRSQLRRFRI